MNKLSAILSSMALAIMCLTGLSVQPSEAAEIDANVEINLTSNVDSAEIVFGGGTLYVQGWEKDNIGVQSLTLSDITAQDAE